MPSLKDLKNRIASVKSTRKITKAMQMVAAAKLRRAQDAAEAARPYTERFNAVMAARCSTGARLRQMARKGVSWAPGRWRSKRSPSPSGRPRRHGGSSPAAV